MDIDIGITVKAVLASLCSDIFMVAFVLKILASGVFQFL